jgi:hypothetical protein
VPEPADSPAPSSRAPFEPRPAAEVPPSADGRRNRDELERRMNSRQPTLIEEFWQFLRFNKKWWLLPILVALLLLGTLVVLSGTALAPFMYPF